MRPHRLEYNGRNLQQGYISLQVVNVTGLEEGNSCGKKYGRMSAACSAC